MTFELLSAEIVEMIHDRALNPGELQGLAQNKSLEGALARVENRLAYNMIDDVFELAAAFAEAIAQGHCFNDGNKRTAFHCLDACLVMNGFTFDFDAQDVGDRIILLAQGKLEAGQLADWLRNLASQA